jgi:pimeloyl-ACP methyl ester carboxylesterase
MNGLGRIAGTVACLVALVAMHRSAAATGPPGDPLESAAPVVIGHSLGALLAVHAIVERPDLFRAAIAISPALTNDERVPDGATPISARLRDALGSRSRQPMALFVTISDGEHRQWLEDLAVAVGERC